MAATSIGGRVLKVVWIRGLWPVAGMLQCAKNPLDHEQMCTNDLKEAATIEKPC
jgi:hypothetical protein